MMRERKYSGGRDSRNRSSPLPLLGRRSREQDYSPRRRGAGERRNEYLREPERSKRDYDRYADLGARDYENRDYGPIRSARLPGYGGERSSRHQGLANYSDDRSSNPSGRDGECSVRLSGYSLENRTRLSDYDGERSKRISDYDGERSKRLADYVGESRTRDSDYDGHRIRRLYNGVSRGDSTSTKFKWNQLLDEPSRNSDGLSTGSLSYGIRRSDDMKVPIDYAVSGGSERDYQGMQYSDTVPSGLLADSKATSSYDRYPFDVSDANRYLFRKEYPISGLDKDMSSQNDLGLNKLTVDRSLSGGLYKEGNALRHPRYDADYMAPSPTSSGFGSVPSGIFKKHVAGSVREDVHLPLDHVRLSPRLITKPIDYDDYGKKLCPRSPVDYGGQLDGIRSYPRSYVSLPKERYYYAYPEVGNSENSHHDILRSSIMDPLVERIDGFSHLDRLGKNRKCENLTYSGVQSGSNYFNAHSSGSLNMNKQDTDILDYGRSTNKYEREVYHDYGSTEQGGHYGYTLDGGTWDRQDEEVTLMLRDRFDEIDGGIRDKLSSEDLSLLGPSKRVSKRKYGVEMKPTRHGVGIEISSNGRKSHKIYDGENGIDSEILSRKQTHGKLEYGKTKRRYNEGITLRLPSTDPSVTLPTRSSNLPRSGSRDIKKRLGPRIRNVRALQSLKRKAKSSPNMRVGSRSQKTLPWLKSVTPYNLLRDKDGSEVLDQEEDSLENNENVTTAKAEPPENSEEFKQLVRNAFFKFVKQLNETPANRRKYSQQGKADNLRCFVCGRHSEDFSETESLVMHTLASPKAGLKSHHLGLHKALCALMGWKSAETSNSPWSREAMSDAETLALKEDLIIWPPVVIIHNSSITNCNPDERVIVSVEELEAKLRDMGFTNKIKVLRGKPANQSIMVVRFSGTLTGLQEAEKLVKVYAEREHGRSEFQQINSSKGRIFGGETQVAFEDKPENVLYGYLGIAEDLFKLDIGTKKQSLVKSKREIQDIAGSPGKTGQVE